MTAPTDERRRRRIDAELRLQADPVLRECVEALTELLASGDQSVSASNTDDVAAMMRYGRAVDAARAALARARGEG